MRFNPFLKRSKKGLRGYDSADAEASELELFIDNDYELYQFKDVIKNNLVKHFCRGNFDAAKAAQGFSYLTMKGSKKYDKEFGTGNRRGGTFDAATRKLVDQSYVKELKAAINYCVTGFQCNDLPMHAATLIKSKKCKVSKPLSGSRGRRR